MKTLILALAAVFALGGCANWSGVKTAVAARSARIADEELATARWANCEVVTAGALTRRYRNDPVGFRRWQEYCAPEDKGVEWR